MSLKAKAISFSQIKWQQCWLQIQGISIQQTYTSKDKERQFSVAPKDKEKSAKTSPMEGGPHQTIIEEQPHLRIFLKTQLQETTRGSLLWTPKYSKNKLYRTINSLVFKYAPNFGK